MRVRKRYFLVTLLGGLVMILGEGVGDMVLRVCYGYVGTGHLFLYTCTNYILLGMMCAGWSAMGGHLRRDLASTRRLWRQMLVIALLDVAGNHLVHRGYKLGVYTPYLLLRLWTVVVVGVGRVLAIGHRVRPYTWVGMLVCGGAGFILFPRSDHQAPPLEPDYMGDCYILIGGTFVAVGTVFTECLLIDHGAVEIVGGIAWIESLASAALLVVVDRRELMLLSMVPAQGMELGVVIVFLPGMMLLLSGLSLVYLKVAGAMAVSLAMLGTNAPRQAMGILLYGDTYSHFIVVSFLFGVVGLAIFSLDDPLPYRVEEKRKREV